MTFHPSNRFAGCGGLPLLAILTLLALETPHARPAEAPMTISPPLLTNAEAWKHLPKAALGGETALPTWARMLAGELPHSTAALLQLDFAQRTAGPVSLGLRAGMRWVAADANGCDYARKQALADARRAGVGDARLEGLAKEGYAGWSGPEQQALRFARDMTLTSDRVTDEQFAALVQAFGERQAASMVLLTAYANFQDRLLISLGAPDEENGEFPPAAKIEFPKEAFVVQTTASTAKNSDWHQPAGPDVVVDDGDWGATSYDTLQQRLETQRKKPTRLRVPEWDEVAKNLPEGLMRRPSDIVWYRIVFGYAPELAVPFEIYLRTAGAEIAPRWDRIFGSSLFWIVTRAIDCPYCMGHCEMNWEVAGLSLGEIADKSRQLAGNDWSSFPPAEQRAFAFARKLTTSPQKITPADSSQILQDFGLSRGIAVLLNASRYHYMTRISNGFQLTLERENVFYDYYNATPPASKEAIVALLTSDECWKRLPGTVSGSGQPLPNWVRGIAGQLPRTAAAMLQLDLAQRTKSPLDPVLRAKMRWVIAHANRCAYTEAYALADLARAGASEEVRMKLIGAPSSWPEEDREPLEFARLLTVAAPTIPDSLFESLRKRVGDKQVAAMVLLAAYSNFQDRIVHGLKLPLEEGGPLPPLVVEFAPTAFQFAPFVPKNNPVPELIQNGKDEIAEDPDWDTVSYDTLQGRLETQRDRVPRLPVPTWDEVKKNIPPAMAARPTRIVWNLVCSGYVPELAVPWSIATRTMWAEVQNDRVLEESLFWIQTRSIGCNYCMGHCEMLLEVAGLDPSGIAERTRRLASSDWSAFPPAEQRAYAYARKLSRTPWDLTAEDYRRLTADYGEKEGMSLFWWLCRGLYMTRVSDGFQLPLERENVFQPLPMTPAAPAAAPAASK